MIGVKYGDDVLTGNGLKSGIIEDLEKANKIDIKSLQDEMRERFNQKRNLGLIPEFKHNIKSNSFNFKNQPKIDFIFILANHNPSSTILKDEIDKTEPDKYPNLNIKFAVSSFMGYGLYKENIYPLKSLRKNSKI